MTIWFTSDMHFGHANIIKYCNRPFEDVNDMTASMIMRWNEVVNPKDIIYVIGDATMGQRELTLADIAKLNGYKYLVPGNHDYIHPMFSNKSAFQNHREMYLEVFDDILDPEYILEDMFRLCHFPYHDQAKNSDYAGRDYSQWEPIDDSKILLCGHVHDLWSHEFTPKGTLQINVGVDVRDFRPISFDEIKAIASSLS